MSSGVSRQVSLMAWVVIAILALLHAYILWSSPAMVDDLYFYYTPLDYWHRFGADLTAALKWLYHHWLTDNGRLANPVAAVLLIFTPRWLAALLCGVALLLQLWLMVRLSGIGANRPWAQVLLCGSAAVLLPWYDAMYMVDVSLNYVWACALMLAVVALFVKPYLSRRSLCWALPLACAAGLWHEAASVPTLCALMVWLVVCPAERSKSRFALLAAILVGTLLCVASPGIHSRAAGVLDMLSDRFLYRAMHHVLVSAPVGLLFVLTLCVMAALRRGRKHLRALMHSKFVVWVVGVVIGLVICAVADTWGRTGWFCQTYAIIGFGALLRPAVQRVTRPLSGLAAALAAGFSALLIASACWQYRQSNTAKKQMEMFRASTDGVIYLDYTTSDEVPWWVLGRVCPVYDNDDFALIHYLRIFDRPHHRQLRILPTEIQNLDLGVSAPDSIPLARDAWLTTHIPPTQAMWGTHLDMCGKIDGRLYSITPLRIAGRTWYYYSPFHYTASQLWDVDIYPTLR